MESMNWMGDAIGRTRLRECLGRDDANKGPYWGQLNR